MGMTAATKGNLLSKLLRNTDFTQAATVYVSLHSADPGGTGANEISGGSYARKPVTFAAPSAGATSNSGALEWLNMPAATITHVALWDASTAGNEIWDGALSASKTVGSGDTFEFATGDLDVNLNS